MKLKQLAIPAILLILVGMAHAQAKPQPKAEVKPTEPKSEAYLKAKEKNDAVFLKIRTDIKKTIIPASTKYRDELNKLASKVKNVDDLQALKLEVKRVNDLLVELEDPDAEISTWYTPPTFKDIKLRILHKRYQVSNSKVQKTLSKKKATAFKTFIKDLDSARRVALLADDTVEAVAINQKRTEVQNQVKILTLSGRFPPAIALLMSHKWRTGAGAVLEFQKDMTIKMGGRPSGSTWSIIDKLTIQNKHPNGWSDVVTFEPKTQKFLVVSKNPSGGFGGKYHYVKVD